MAENEPISILINENDRHPASLAWQQIDGGKYAPQVIEVLQQHKKSEIYRLRDGTPGRRAIIAKHCLSETGKLEQVIYEEILPLLPISRLRYYGCLEEAESDLWIFLEDAGEQSFSPADDSHRLLAAHWLGWLHRSARQTGVVEILPLRDPAYYYEMMREGSENIVQNIENPALTLEYIDILKSVLAKMETLEANWGNLVKFCQDFPQTMVHADFQPKNIRIKQGATGDVLCVLDWEMAGWGLPAVDLAPSHGMSSSSEVDLTVYLTIAREFWHNLDMPTLRFAVHVGLVFRRLAATYWSSTELSYPWVEKPVLSMEIYQKELAQALTHVFGKSIQ